MARKPSAKKIAADRRMDKKLGIKEGSKADQKMDRKMGLPAKGY